MAAPSSHADTLVTNLSNSDDGFWEAGVRVAQAFVTGDQSAGYKLDAVELRISKPSGSTRGLRVQLYTATLSGIPDDRVFTFLERDIPPGDISNYRFEAPAGTRLDPNTTYFINFQQSGGSGGNLSAGTTNNLGQTGFANWSIADKRYWHNNFDWIRVQNNPYRMTVLGEAVLPELSVVGDASASEDRDMAFTVTLSHPTAEEVTATWTASIESGDTAVAADLGSTTTGMVTFAPNATTATFTGYCQVEQNLPVLRKDSAGSETENQ